MAIHSSVLAWRILRTEELDRLQSMRLKESDRTEWLTPLLTFMLMLPFLKLILIYFYSSFFPFFLFWSLVVVVVQLCPALCNPMDCSMPGFPVLHHVPKFAQTHELMMPSNHLFLCHPCLLLPLILPSIRVFSNELALHIRWPKDWSFSISPSNEYPGLISFRIDWFDLLSVQETLKSLLQYYSLETSLFMGYN